MKEKPTHQKHKTKKEVTKTINIGIKTQNPSGLYQF
jgi:hypothetical protein